MHNKTQKIHGLVVGFLIKTRVKKFSPLEAETKEVRWVEKTLLPNLPIADLFKPHYLKIFGRNHWVIGPKYNQDRA